MIQRLLLLTGAFEARPILPFLGRLNPGCTLVHAETLPELESALADTGPKTRLLAFCTSVIVPGRLLQGLAAGAYNIHPGPPNFPGRHPESWGAYTAIREFGATLHEMADRVDEGAIIDVAWFTVPEGAGQIGYALPAYEASFELLRVWGADLVGSDAALPRSDLVWSGRKTRHSDLEAMCEVTPDIDAVEFERRRRAFAETAGSEMRLTLHGVTFRYTVPSSG